MKTPTFTRELRYTFQKLQNQGQLGENTRILLRVGEKLATKLDIIKHENEGLHKAVLHEKKNVNAVKL